MASQTDLDQTYLRMAKDLSFLSKAQRAKVGCLIIRDTQILADGVNGTPSGFDNRCEYEKDLDGYVELWHEKCGECYREPLHEYLGLTKEEYAKWVQDPKSVVKLITRPEVIHAEMNALAKIAKSTQSSDGATLYATLSPCFSCARLIIQSGIKRVVFSEYYSDQKGLDFLVKCNVETERIQI